MTNRSRHGDELENDLDTLDRRRGRQVTITDLLEQADAVLVADAESLLNELDLHALSSQ